MATITGYAVFSNTLLSVFLFTVEFEEEDPDLAAVNVRMTSPDRSLRAIAEDEEVLDEAEEDETAKEDKRQDMRPVGRVDELADNNGNQGLTEEELGILSKRLFLSMMRSFSLNPFQNKPLFLCVCSTSLLKTPWEEEKLVVRSIFSFPHNIFYLSRELLPFSSNLKLISANSVSLKRV